MIEVKNLTKLYGNFTAIKNVSFKAERGSILGFLGPNGAGKTTTMRIITGYMPASAGTVLIDGLDIFTESLEARRRIGYLPENPPLYTDMRVEPYLRFVAKLRGVPRSKMEAALDHALEVCGLVEMRGRICGQLSKVTGSGSGWRGVDPRSSGAGARRADDRTRSAPDSRDSGPYQNAVGRAHGGALDPYPARGFAICDWVAIIADGQVVLEEKLSEIPAGTSLEQVFLEAISKERHSARADDEESLEEVGAGRA